MKNQITITDLNNAYDSIKRIIDIKLDRDNVKFIASELAPNSYKAMRQYRDDFGQFLVYSGGDHGFLGEEYNVKFRALHDSMHYAENLSFSFKDEKQLSLLTQWDFMQIAYNDLGLTQWETWVIGQVINAEIRGQVEYYELNKKYVEDQSKFILSYLEVEQ